MTEHHLGDSIHDLLDNRLSAARAAQAMEHMASCAQCKSRWDELRATREALKTSEAGIDLRFAQQLLDRERMAQIARDETPERARAARPRGRSPLVTVVAVIAILGIVVSAGYIVGEPDEVGLEFAETGTVVGASAEVMQVGAQSMRSGDALRSWVHPNWEATGLTPVEATVVRARTGDNVLVASLLAGLEQLVVTQQHGQLSPLVAEYYPSVDLGHAPGYLISDWPRQLVWQTGDVVISLSCTCAAATLESVAVAFPADDEPTFVGRVADGLGEIADLMTPDP
ncbi:anti-sigma factor family protein [Demequina sp.]|uniref:anti-sigma factor family protein n=1 Tax=Demequina sp. TaxID=2050685 RepID=UPI003A88A6DA